MAHGLVGRRSSILSTSGGLASTSGGLASTSCGRSPYSKPLLEAPTRRIRGGSLQTSVLQNVVHLGRTAKRRTDLTPRGRRAARECCGPSHGRQQNTRSQNAYTCSSKPSSSSWEAGWADSYSNGRGLTTADGPGLEESLDDRGLSDSTTAGSVPSGTAKAQILCRDQKVLYFKQTQ